MDHKTWPWKKRTSAKAIVENKKDDLFSRGNEEEILASEKELALERSVESLNEKLVAIIGECNAKDELMANQAKMTEEAIADREKAEAEVVHLKQELEGALRQGVAANERLFHLNTALKDCMQQLSLAREDQEQRVLEAVMNTSRELEKVHRRLEEKLKETTEKLWNANVENSQLSKAVIVKEKLIEDLSTRTCQTEAEFKTLMARLDSTEKENAFLKYEFCMLEKEVEIRNEEIQYSRQSAEALHVQHLESMKKMAKLEAECQRLRVLMRKRLPSSAALGKLKSEVEIQGRNQIEARRRNMKPATGGLIVRDFHPSNLPEVSCKNINFVIERLCHAEEENKILKAVLAKKEDELQLSRVISAQRTLKMSQVEAQMGNLLRDQKPTELVLSNHAPNELSPKKDSQIIKSGPWASPLVSDFRYGESKNSTECRRIEVPDMSLMDDFVEMERLAIVAVDSSFGGSCASSDVDYAHSDSFPKELCNSHEESTGKELVLVGQGDSINMDQQHHVAQSDWVGNVLKIILEQKHVSNRGLDELLEDVKIALHYGTQTCFTEAYAACSTKNPESSKALTISGYFTLGSPHTTPNLGSIDAVLDAGPSVESDNEDIQSNMNWSIREIMEVIRILYATGLRDGNIPNTLSEQAHNTSTCKHTEKQADYMIHVFLWNSCELSTVLQKLIRTCNDLQVGKVDFEKFTGVLASAFGWIKNNCITSQDISSLGKKDWKRRQEENIGSKYELKSFIPGDLEMRLELANGKCEALMKQLQETEQRVGTLQTELENLTESKRYVEDLLENQRVVNEELDTQITVARAKLNEVLQKMSSLEVEMEYKSRCCEELESTCLELQLQLESITSQEIPMGDLAQEDKLLQNAWEIKAASAKLVECQETILHLGKQLKALASPKDVAVIEKALSTASSKKLNQRSSLRDQMLAEDQTRTEDLKSPRTEDTTSEPKRASAAHLNNCNSFLTSSDLQMANPAAACLGFMNESKASAAFKSGAIVQSKKHGGVGLLRKLLFRRKRRSNSKRIPVPFAG